MLLQTNSYIVPKEKRVEHARLVRRFRQTLARLGCEHLEVYEQVGANWGSGETTGRFVQIMRFRDRKHQLAVQAAERNDAAAQALINEFCELINFPYQQQQGLFAVGFYQSALPVATMRPAASGTPTAADETAVEAAVEETGDEALDQTAVDDRAVEDASANETTVEDAAPGTSGEDAPGAAEAGEPDASDHVDLGNADASASEPSTRRNA
ncbi:MAG TPA: hypothetical protein VGR35_08870 [Tepidisphaeraceae bacterium]|nr:hypothetical protein [Tepidisphaeraceae bacterium]